ncbi:TraR/DksA C4-type zinc finger protein [Pseudomonas koreensis]|uniref:Prokaryotic dksA/traR C4-type zinc finger n=1 Tax=Pseudomonas koreensis TaxID=198620 RepID=A0AA94JH42_9PSED|nr:TraR/DksA C4-type zinc finger protein [Pseudomonas koreensis]RVD77041.1 Prokaryotic dksA/traR C4-type zinc finger [Pseudomonas koreensis]
MADIVDLAGGVIEETVQHGLKQIVRYTGISAKECEECGEDIPEDRRAAVKGVKVCAPCGALVELKAKGVRRL